MPNGIDVLNDKRKFRQFIEDKKLKISLCKEKVSMQFPIFITNEVEIISNDTSI